VFTVFSDELKSELPSSRPLSRTQRALVRTSDFYSGTAQDQRSSE
jgi:hypothetical protein